MRDGKLVNLMACRYCCMSEQQKREEISRLTEMLGDVCQILENVEDDAKFMGHKVWPVNTKELWKEYKKKNEECIEKARDLAEFERLKNKYGW